MKRVDACGRACPEPVLMTKQALKASSEGVEVLVDNTTAVANITRFAQNAGYKIQASEAAGVHTLILTK